MKILLDIGHPGHVHLFKNFIKIMETKGHKFLITARSKECTLSLLNAYNIDYIVRPSYSGFLGKILGMFKIDHFIYKQAKKFQPDIMIGGVGNAYIAQVSWLLGIPSYIFDDTEFATLQLSMMRPFAKNICTPKCYWKDLGKKQVRYNGYHEIAYLHPKYFKPDVHVLKELGVKKEENFFILRFVSWEANHDSGYHGFTDKKNFVKKLEKYGKVFISSERALPNELEKYKINVPPEKMHSILYYATLFIGESSTMASECAVLGTPAIFISTSRRGYTNEEEEKYDLVYTFDDPLNGQMQAMEKALQLISKKNLKQEWKKKTKAMLNDKIDVTGWMVKLIE